MGVLEPFDNKGTKWSGLWYHPSSHYFTSATFSLADLRKFKGNVRLVVKKNRFYENGENKRPNYVFIIADSKSEKYRDLEVVEDKSSTMQILSDEGSWETSYYPFYPGCVNYYKCSLCGEKNDKQTNFCPNCGAEMV